MGKTATKKATQRSTSSAYSSTFKWPLILVGVGLLISFCKWLDTIKERWYVFEPTALHELAQAAIAQAPNPNDTASMIQYIMKNLTETYPQTGSPRVAINTNEEWFLNNAAGAMGAVFLIHASITEYLMIFGTPLGTEGHTGVYAADDYFHILTGEQWAFSPGQLEMEVYKPGSVHHLPRGYSKQYKMHHGCWALEYARGWIPSMVPIGLMDGLTSTMDVFSLYHTVRISGREILRNLWIGKI